MQLNKSMFDNLQVMVIGHRYVYGPGEALVDFLIDERIKSFVVCFHSIPQVDSMWHLRDLTSVLEYEKGNLIYKTTLRIAGTTSIKYVAQFFLSCILPLIRRRRFHVAIGEGLPNVLACLILKKAHCARTVVYHAHSFQPSMFHGFRRMLYTSLIRLAVRESDWVWNLSERLAKLSKSLGAQDRRNFVVPVGIDARFLKVRSHREPKGVLVFVGHLKDDNGIKLVAKAMSRLRRSYPNIKLVVIGGGPLFDWLKRFIDHSELQENISMLGPLPYPKVMEILSQCDIGIAMYKPSNTSITKVTDPMKLKMYLAAGLPVVMTSIPWLSSKVNALKAGLVINYDEEEFVQAVTEILHNYEVYHANAVKLASSYEFWDSRAIFKNVMEKVVRTLA